MKKIKVVLVEDHKMIRQMWVAMFDALPGFTLVGECDTPEAVVELCSQKKPDIVLLDINLKKQSGLDAIPLIRAASPDTKVIMVSMHNQPAFAKKAFALGANGYVTKNSAPAEVVKAITTTLKGDRYICEEIRNIIALSDIDEMEGMNALKALSVRETEIAGFLRDGLSSKEIGDKLNISVRTVEVHRQNILKKLKVKNTIALVQLINENGLLL